MTSSPSGNERKARGRPGGAKLKVFAWSDGFHVFTVAAASRPKALAAWGMSGDIFKTGLAHEAPDSPDAEAALASPGEVIERGTGIDPGKVAKRPKDKPPKGPSPAAKRKVAALEQELETLDEAQAGEVQALEDKRAKLETQAAALIKAYDEARNALVTRLKTARAKL